MTTARIMEVWYFFALIGFLQIILTQGNPQMPPPQCRGPHQFTKHPKECCKIPDLFEEKIFSDCGFPPPEAPHGPPDCKKSICVFEKYNLTKSDDNLDKEKFAAAIDQWAEAHSDWKPAANKVKERCLSKELPGPPQACEFDKTLFCTTITFIENCPAWEDSEDCVALKKHIDECKVL